MGRYRAAVGHPDGPDGEVMLDIEVAGAVAPGATLAIYFAPNTDAGFLNAIRTAVHDTVNNFSVISISWGGPESSWTSQAMQAFDEAFQSAAAMGIAVCIASGDDGSTDGGAFESRCPMDRNKRSKRAGFRTFAVMPNPQTGYDVRVDGQDAVFGGTSAVAPLWAGLLTAHQ